MSLLVYCVGCWPIAKRLAVSQLPAVPCAHDNGGRRYQDDLISLVGQRIADLTATALVVARRPRHMVSREEALERAEQDRGDDDDVVWMTQTKKGQSRIYHDNPQCSYLSTNGTDELTRGQAQNRGYGACKVCTLETADWSSTGSPPADLIETVQQKMADSDR